MDNVKPFHFYLLMLFFIVLADSAMSYYVPLVIEKVVVSTTVLGLILASSSIAGSFMDLWFAKSYPDKNSFFFNKILISLTFLFPMSFIAYKAVPSFFFAMIVWGIYFEAMVFSNYHAVHEYVDKSKHIWAWSMVTLGRNLGFVIGPLAALSLAKYDPNFPFFFALIFYSLALLLFLVRLQIRKKTPDLAVEKSGLAEIQNRPIWKELRIWLIYEKVIWPLLALHFLYFVIESTFFSIGPLLGEELTIKHPLGWLFFTAYTLPTLLSVFLLKPLSLPFGKKKAAMLAGLLAGFMLLGLGLSYSVPLVLIFTFCSSIGLSILHPELLAVFEDFVARAGKTKNDLIGLTAIMGSISYVVGPIAAGILADRLGAQKVFSILGIWLLLATTICFALVRRKVELPQKRLANETS